MSTEDKKIEVVDSEVVGNNEVVVDSETTLNVDEEESVDADNVSDDTTKSCDIESKLTEELRVAKDKYIRLSAEFDNYRKRTLKEKMELVENGGRDVIKSVITVLDDFDRAQGATDNTTDIDAIKEGNQLVHNKLIDVLKQKGLKEIVSMGEEFDTDFFEAIVKIPVEDKDQKGKVVDVIEKGYMLNDKVLRFAKVVVGE